MATCPECGYDSYDASEWADAGPTSEAGVTLVCCPDCDAVVGATNPGY